jgi:hypothetical protein
VLEHSLNQQLRSLLCQLLQPSGKIPACLDTLYSSSENGKRQPSLHALLEVVKQMIQKLPQVYVLLDALDECAQRTELMDIFESISGWQLQNLHLLVTSRKERDIEGTLDSFIPPQNKVCLQSKIVDKDIQRYVKQRLSSDRSLRKWENNTTVKQEIEATLMGGAHGMYLHIYSLADLMLMIVTGFDGLYVSLTLWGSAAIDQCCAKH